MLQENKLKSCESCGGDFYTEIEADMVCSLGCKKRLALLGRDTYRNIDIKKALRILECLIIWFGDEKGCLKASKYKMRNFLIEHGKLKKKEASGYINAFVFYKHFIPIRGGFRINERFCEK